MAARITHLIRGLVLGAASLFPMTFPLVTSATVLAVATCSAFGSTAATVSAAIPQQAFDIPTGDAADTLKRFAEKSGQQIVYLVDLVRGVKTNSLKGQFTAREALKHLVAGTVL